MLIRVVLSILGSVIFLTGCNNEERLRLSDVIHVSMRSSLLDSSTGVLQITNNSSESIVLFLSIKNLENLQMKQSTQIFKPNETKELGRIEISWEFVPNEKIDILKVVLDTNGKSLAPDNKYSVLSYKTYRTSEGEVGLK